MGRPPSARGLLFGIVALLALGLVATVAYAASLGFWAMGLAFGARLAFLLILALAVLPWIGRSRG
ncbi:MAG: hypothetical protein ACK41C_01000 [Phenylobacterium sp.]|uniref:hypothetical protein n=1 Tax=Phenylobacterium sp. TaxID=1871053 RepID=UPI00391B84C1